MKTLLLYIVLFVPSFCFAQRAELKEYCNELTSLLKQEKPMHLQYMLTIRGRDEVGDEGKMTMHWYKKGSSFRIVMGEAQEVIQAGKTIVVVNHVQKTMVVQEDTSDHGLDNSLLGDLNELTDSAAHVRSSNKEGLIVFTLSYPPDFIYTKVELSFSEKSRRIVSLYAEFSPEYPADYLSMRVDYQKWDMAWKPETGFPFLEKYVLKSGSRYQVQASWKQYQFFQPEKGILNIKP